MESLAYISKVLPSGLDGAAADRVAPLFVAYFAVVFGRALEAVLGGARDERESRTLCEAMGLLLRGRSLPAIMILLSRSKAIEEAARTEAERERERRSRSPLEVPEPLPEAEKEEDMLSGASDSPRGSQRG